MSASKVILITGANTGIGFELARLLAQKGHKVYLGARSTEKGQKAKESLKSDGLSNVEFVEIDVTSDKSVNAARDAIEAAEGRLDSLVNNAGIPGRFTAAANTITVADFEETLSTNFYGVIRVTDAFIPLLRKSSGTPTILNVGSELGSNGDQAKRPEFPYSGAPYCVSKAALNSYTIKSAVYLKDSGFKVNVVTPGYTATNLNNFQGYKTVQNGALSLLPFAVLDKDGPNGKFFAEDGSEHIW